MADAKARTDSVELSKLPKNTQSDTSVFNNGCTKIVEGVYQNISVDAISSLGYVIYTSKELVYSRDIDQNITLIDHCKEIKILQGEDYNQENNVVYSKIHKACVGCGLTWIKDNTEKKM